MFQLKIYKNSVSWAYEVVNVHHAKLVHNSSVYRRNRSDEELVQAIEEEVFRITQGRHKLVIASYPGYTESSTELG